MIIVAHHSSHNRLLNMLLKYLLRNSNKHGVCAWEVCLFSSVSMASVRPTKVGNAVMAGMTRPIPNQLPSWIEVEGIKKVLVNVTL